jgi:hypothetical protein
MPFVTHLHDGSTCIVRLRCRVRNDELLAGDQSEHRVGRGLRVFDEVAVDGEMATVEPRYFDHVESPLFFAVSRRAISGVANQLVTEATAAAYSSGRRNLRSHRCSCSPLQTDLSASFLYITNWKHSVRCPNHDPPKRNQTARLWMKIQNEMDTGSLPLHLVQSRFSRLL